MANKLPLTKIVLDVLKPIEPSIIVFCRELSKIKGIRVVNLSVIEMDRKTETIKATIEGKNVDFNSIRKTIEDLGAVIHSIDQVVISK